MYKSKFSLNSIAITAAQNSPSGSGGRRLRFTIMANKQTETESLDPKAEEGLVQTIVEIENMSKKLPAPQYRIEIQQQSSKGTETYTYSTFTKTLYRRQPDKDVYIGWLVLKETQNGKDTIFTAEGSRIVTLSSINGGVET